MRNSPEVRVSLTRDVFVVTSQVRLDEYNELNKKGEVVDKNIQFLERNNGLHYYYDICYEINPPNWRDRIDNFARRHRRFY